MMRKALFFSGFHGINSKVEYLYFFVFLNEVVLSTIQ